MIRDIGLFDYNCRILKFMDRDMNDRSFGKVHYTFEDGELWFSLKDYMGVPDFVVEVADYEPEIYNEE